MKARIPIFAAVLLALAPCEAQVKIQLDGGRLILNGGVPGVLGTMIKADGEAEGEEANPTAAQMLEFADGSRLHGTLAGLDGEKKELVWRGVDASAPLTFPLAQLSRVDFPPPAKTAVKARATVKLTGADWLAGEVLGLADGRLQLRLGDGAVLAVDRARLEWIFFSKTGAPECYDGPQNLAGWVSNGGWTCRDGALRTTQATVIGRLFEALPDRVEYRFEYDPGANMRAFTILLHGAEPTARGFGPGMVRLMMNDTTLQVWAQREDNLKQETVDLTKALPALAKTANGAPATSRKPMSWRIFEDRPTGRLVVLIDGRKVGDWHLGKNKAGENRGCFSFQPMGWSPDSEQSLAKIRVAPWSGFVPVDNALDDARPRTDQVVLTDGDLHEGRIESLGGGRLKIGAVSLAREKIALVRFARPANPPEEDPAVARLRLAEGGEFDAAAIDLQDGKMRVRTSFGGEVVMTVAALRSVEFAHLTPVAGKSVDVVVFQNGDQLRGSLQSAGHGEKLRWRGTAAAPVVEMETSRMTGVSIAPRGERPPARSGVLARCRNGDLIAGDFAALDGERLALESGAAGRIAIPRERLRALYFSQEGKLPVFDGATEHEVWEAGLDFTRGMAEQRKKRLAEGKPGPGPWSYFDGAFTVKRSAATRANAGGNSSFNLGRIADGLPARVEFSFDVIAKKNQVFFSAQLFSEPENLGYEMRLHPAGLFIYDAGGQQRGRVMAPQQQIQFGDKVKADAPRHRIRVLADRPTGRMTILIDDAVVTQFGPRTGAPLRNLGRGLGLMPQQNLVCTFANLWIGPWNGRPPGEPAAPGAPPDAVLLANGDEARGTILGATPDALQIESEVGALDLPMRRLIWVDFGGSEQGSSAGVRLRLSDRSVFTVSTYRIENGSVICQSDVAGEITFPLSAVAEIIFTPPVLPEKTGAKTSRNPIL